MKYYNFFVLIKRIRKKKRPIKDKLQIENADMRIIKCHTNFITDLMQQIVNLLLVGKTCQY